MFTVYLLRCGDGSLYAGITTDPARRLRQHRGELRGGARYTATRQPVAFAALWEAPDRSRASRLEAKLKRASHADKERLAAGEDPSGLITKEYRRAEAPIVRE